MFDRLKIEYPLTEKSKKPQLKAEFLKTVEHPIAQMIVDIEELKKNEEALNWCQKAVNSIPENAEFNALLANLKVLTEDYDEGILFKLIFSCSIVQEGK